MSESTRDKTLLLRVANWLGLATRERDESAHDPEIVRLVLLRARALQADARAQEATSSRRDLVERQADDFEFEGRYLSASDMVLADMQASLRYLRHTAQEIADGEREAAAH